MSDLANRLRAETMPFRDLRTTRRNEVLYEAADRIEKLEAALREIAAPDWIYDGAGLRDMARKALEGKNV